MLFQYNIINFQDLVKSGQDIGVFDVFLPFLLVFAIVFAILEKTKIFGEKKANINSVIALVIGLLIVAQKDVVATINSFLPRAALIMIIILMFLLLLAMVAGREYAGLKELPLGIAVIAIAVMLIIALSPSISISQDTKNALLTFGLPIAILFGIIFFITGGSSKEEGKSEYGVVKFLEDLGKGVK